MTALLRNPALLLALLGALSGQLGTYALGVGIGEAPHPGIYMILTGVWFGCVIGFGIWQYGNRSLVAVATAVAGTWVGWEIAVNLAMQITENWLKGVGISNFVVTYFAGFAAGSVGAALTWAGAAAFTPALRKASVAGMVTYTGAVFGLLLPWTNELDIPALLFVPWQAAVAGVLGFGLAAPATASGKPEAWWPRRT